MEIFTGDNAYKQLHQNLVKKVARVPNKQSENFIEGGVFPILQPKFKIKKGSKIFTIGSCFARHIEDVLIKRGYDVPVSKFTLPEGEIRFPGPHILNEYNAGSLWQRVASLVGEFEYTPEKGIETTDKGDVDLFLHVLNQPVVPLGF